MKSYHKGCCFDKLFSKKQFCRNTFFVVVSFYSCLKLSIETFHTQSNEFFENANISCGCKLICLFTDLSSRNGTKHKPKPKDCC